MSLLLLLLPPVYLLVFLPAVVALVDVVTWWWWQRWQLPQPTAFVVLSAFAVAEIVGAFSGAGGMLIAT